MRHTIHQRLIRELLLSGSLLVALAIQLTAQDSSIPAASPNLPVYLTFTPSSVNFGNAIVGTNSSAQVVTITNVGILPVFITSISAGAPFAQTNSCPQLLLPRQSCTANVTFIPTSGGTAAGTLTVTPLIRRPVSASLSGNGEVLTSLVISPPQAAIKFGQQLQLTATGYFADGSQQDLTSQVAWSSSNPNVITVSNNPANPGLLTTESTGVVTVTNTLNGCVNCPTGSATFGALPIIPRFAYAANEVDSTISAYTVDADTGRLRNNGYYYLGTGFFPFSVAVDPYNRFLYVAGEELGQDGISGYQINATSGVLTPTSAGVTTSGTGSPQLAIDPLLGQFLYAVDGHSVSEYTINPTSGALTLIGSACCGVSTPIAIALDPTGSYAYVVDQSSQNVYSFSINPTTGSLGLIPPGVPVPTGSFPTSVAVDPTSSYVYVTNYAGGTVSAYSIGKNGGLTAISGSPFSVGLTPSSILSYGCCVWITDSEAGNVLSFKVNSSGGLVLPGLAFSSQGQSPSAETTDGSYLYVANGDTNEIAVFGMDTTTGNLNYWRSTRARVTPYSLSLGYGTRPVTYTPRFAFIDGASEIAAYTISPSTGVLTYGSLEAKNFSGNSFGFGADTPGISIDGKFLIEQEFDSSNNRFEVSYSIDSGSGALSVVNSLSQNTFFIGPGEMYPAVVEPSGRWVYEGGSPCCGPGGVGETSAELGISTTGTLTGISVENPNPNALTMGSARVAEGAGRFLVSIDPSSSCLAVHSIDPRLGGLTPVNILCFFGIGGTGSYSNAAIDPRGRFLYASLQGRNIDLYSIDPVSGNPTYLSSFGSDPGGGPLAVDPTGRFLYLASIGSGVTNLSQWAINEVDGTLTSIASDIDLSGANIDDLQVDISGNYLYLADSASTSLYAFSIDQSTGALTALVAPFLGFVPTGGLALSGSVN